MSIFNNTTTDCDLTKCVKEFGFIKSVKTLARETSYSEFEILVRANELGITFPKSSFHKVEIKQFIRDNLGEFTGKELSELTGSSTSMISSFIRSLPEKFILDSFSQEGEEWGTLKDFSNYRVSTKGRIISFRSTPRLMATYRKTHLATQYKHVACRLVNDSGTAVILNLRRVVYQVFVDPDLASDRLILCIDGDNFNSELSNLKNIAASSLAGLVCAGEDNFNAIYSSEQITHVCELISDGGNSSRLVAEITGVGIETVSLVWQKRSWKHISVSYDFPDIDRVSEWQTAHISVAEILNNSDFSDEDIAIRFKQPVAKIQELRQQHRNEN